MSIAAIWFSTVIATIPDEWQEFVLASLNPPVLRVDVESDGEKKTEPLTMRDLLFAGDVDGATRRRKSLFSNTLVLPGFNLYDALKIDEPKKLAWKKHLLDLRARHLEQAVFNGADLTKADLYGAQPQGASLRYAQLQGASLDGAELQGASLDSAILLGASLDRAQVQGALLDHAGIRATDFSSAILWRTQWGEIDPERLGAVRLKDATWRPIWRESVMSHSIEWTGKACDELRDSIINSIPEGKWRDNALKQIEILDCGSPDKTLASCDPAAEPQRELWDWQNKFAQASVDDSAYAKALAAELQSLVCANDTNAIHILRGIMRGGLIYEMDREAPALVDFIMSKNCPVPAALTDGDKARLLEIT